MIQMWLQLSDQLEVSKGSPRYNHHLGINSCASRKTLMQPHSEQDDASIPGEPILSGFILNLFTYIYSQLSLGSTIQNFDCPLGIRGRRERLDISIPRERHIGSS